VNIVPEISYRPGHGFRGLGDLYLPDSPDGAPAALVIHGGGWRAMDKHGLAGIAQLMAELGHGAYNINYRLLGDGPWPACGDDCLAAARFLLDAEHEAMETLDRSRIVVIGASAGGHLALMTGLRLEPDRVRAIVDIAGPSDMRIRAQQDDFPTFGRDFFGSAEITDEMLLDASPVHLVRPGAPPLLCVHSLNDTLVPIVYSERMIEAYSAVGARAELHAYDGPGDKHGIWVEGTDPHRLLPELEKRIAEFLASVG